VVPAAWRQPLGLLRVGTSRTSDRALSDAWLIEKIREIWAENRKVYGSPRIHADLRLKYGIRVARKRDS
jgi:transposase InsO family protein